MTLVKIISPFIIVVLLMIASCKNAADKNSSLIFEELNESLERSNKAIKGSIDVIMHAFRERLVKPIYVERARLYEPKINYIKEESDDTYNYITELKAALLMHEKNIAEKDIKKYQDNEGVEKVFIEERKSDSLFFKFHRLKENILNVDSLLKKNLEKEINKGVTAFGSIKSKEDFSKYFFESRSLVEVFSFLTKMQNDVLLTEYMAINYCFIVSNSNDDTYSFETPWIFQNTHCLKSGDELKFRVVIAESRNNLDFKVILDGVEVPNDNSYIRECSKRIYQPPGKYKSTVRVEFTDKFGNKDTSNQVIEYQVVKK